MQSYFWFSTIQQFCWMLRKWSATYPLPLSSLHKKRYYPAEAQKDQLTMLAKWKFVRVKPLLSLPFSFSHIFSLEPPTYWCSHRISTYCSFNKSQFVNRVLALARFSVVIIVQQGSTSSHHRIITFPFICFGWDLVGGLLARRGESVEADRHGRGNSEIQQWGRQQIWKYFESKIIS